MDLIQDKKREWRGKVENIGEKEENWLVVRKKYCIEIRFNWRVCEALEASEQTNEML